MPRGLKVLQPKTRTGYIRKTKTGGVAFVPPHQQGYWINPEKDIPKDNKKLLEELKNINGKGFTNDTTLELRGIEPFIDATIKEIKTKFIQDNPLGDDIFAAAAAYLLATGEKKQILKNQLGILTSLNPKWGFGLIGKLSKIIGADKTRKIIEEINPMIEDVNKYALQTLNTWVQGSADTFSYLREGLNISLADVLTNKKTHDLHKVVDKIYSTTQDILDDPEVKKENYDFVEFYRGLTVIASEEPTRLEWGKLVSTTVWPGTARKFADQENAQDKIPENVNSKIIHDPQPFADITHEVKYIPKDVFLERPAQLSIFLYIQPRTKRQIFAILHGKGLRKTIERLGGEYNENDWFEHETEVVAFI